MLKSGCFWKLLQWRAPFFSKITEGCQDLFEILHTWLTLKNRENVVKSGYFERPLPWRAPCFFETKENIRYLVQKYSYFAILIGEIHLIHYGNLQKCGKNWMFLKNSAIECAIRFEMKKGCWSWLVSKILFSWFIRKSIFVWNITHSTYC